MGRGAEAGRNFLLVTLLFLVSFHISSTHGANRQVQIKRGTESGGFHVSNDPIKGTRRPKGLFCDRVPAGPSGSWRRWGAGGGTAGHGGTPAKGNFGCSGESGNGDHDFPAIQRAGIESAIDVVGSGASDEAAAGRSEARFSRNHDCVLPLVLGGDRA